IDVALAEAKSYCSRYDLAAIFGTQDTNATVIDPNLKGKVKDLAAYHLCILANINIDYAVLKERYDDAVRWFRDLQAGKLAPENWTYRDTSTLPTPPQGNEIGWSSN